MTQPFNKFNVASLLWKHGRGVNGILGPIEENIADELNAMAQQALATPPRVAEAQQAVVEAARSYPDDHGQYYHVACGICRAPFDGGKGRVVCAVCKPAGDELARLRMTYEPEKLAEAMRAAMSEGGR